MIELIEFTNFKALRATRLPLSPFTLLLGPNGSGKSSVLQAIRLVATRAAKQLGANHAADEVAGRAAILSLTSSDHNADVQVRIRLRLVGQAIEAVFFWRGSKDAFCEVNDESGTRITNANDVLNWLSGMQTFALEQHAIAQPAQVTPRAALGPSGKNLAAVLDDLRDNDKDRFNALEAELCRWLPEYTEVRFDKPQPGVKVIKLRTRRGGHFVPASDLSHGTLVSLTLLTLAYLPNPPTLIGLEEIDRGLHPRLMRHLRDALDRLSHPENCGESRPPIQVIATTHSPYLLDLYRDRPAEVVIAEKEGLEVSMRRLSDIDHFEDILGDAPLSEVWYSGVLGGVSVKP